MCMETALRLYEQDGTASEVASVLKQAAASSRNSYHAKAYDFASTAPEKCRCPDDHLAIADAFLWAGSSFTAQDKVEEAMPFLEEKESLEVFQRHGHAIGMVQRPETMGEIHRRNHRHEEALATLREAVTIASRSGGRLEEAKPLLILGCSYWNKGGFKQGATTLTAVCDMVQRTGRVGEDQLDTEHTNDVGGEVALRPGDFGRLCGVFDEPLRFVVVRHQEPTTRHW